MNKIEKSLFELQEPSIKKSSLKVIPNLKEDRVIGVSISKIRELAKEIKGTKEAEDFLTDLPHTYLEENELHGILLSISIKDIEELLEKLNIFLPYADNWAITDIISPKLFKKYPDKVYKEIKKWLKSKDIYTVRFAVVSLLQFFLDDNFKPEILDLLINIKGDYYINMAVAWFYSFALIKQYDETIKIIENKELDSWIHNKSIQKAIESRRISEERKTYLRSLKDVKKDK